MDRDIWGREINEDGFSEEEELELPPGERERLLSAMMRMIELGMGAVYSSEHEDDGGVDALPHCADRLEHCRAACCRLHFALTRQEVQAGHIRYMQSRPYFIERHEADGYCVHLDRDSMRCSIWERRPLRCRRYDCGAQGPEIA